MSRFVIKFSKDGYIKYISHLDLLRVFKRTFKVCDIKLKYSQGYNPHPKMGFAQPLSLGYSSSCEYLEIDTDDDKKPKEILFLLKNNLPDGIEISEVFPLRNEIKSLAAVTTACTYRISMGIKTDEKTAENKVASYLAQKEIFAEKRMKKTKKFEPVEIRQMIQELSVEFNDGELILNCKLDSGSTTNLSPELLIKSFIEFSGFNVQRHEIEVERTGILFSDCIRI